MRLASKMQSIPGGVEAHGIQILERAAHSYVQKHDRYPVIALDHVDPTACSLSNPTSPILHLGRAINAAEPSMRSVLIFNDAQLETLRQGLLVCNALMTNSCSSFS